MKNIAPYRMATGRFGTCPPGRRGFSLIEVVLSVGIVAFGIVAIIGVYSGLLGRSAENSERHRTMESVDALRAFLNTESPFPTVLEWVRDGKELLYVTHASDPTGKPVPPGSGAEVRGVWLDPDNLPSGTTLDKFESARVGRWVRARLQLASSGNPAGVTSLPGDAGTYPESYFVAMVEMDTVSDPNNQAMPENPRFQFSVGVRR